MKKHSAWDSGRNETTILKMAAVFWNETLTHTSQSAQHRDVVRPGSRLSQGKVMHT